MCLYTSGIGIFIGIIIGVAGVIVVLLIGGILNFYGRYSWWCLGKSFTTHTHTRTHTYTQPGYIIDTVQVVAGMVGIMLRRVLK